MWRIISFVFEVINILLDNPVTSLKITSTVISSLTLVVVYLFARRLNLSISLSVIATLLVLFNPFFLYYAGGILPLAESLSVFLFTLGFFFYFSVCFFFSLLYALCSSYFSFFFVFNHSPMREKPLINSSFTYK